jgi:hypothetical protein
MSDFSLYTSLVAQRLQDDNTLNALVDGQVISGFQRTLADNYLTKTNQALVGVRNLNDRSQGLPGCAMHGTSKHDQLLEIRIITKILPERQDDSYAAAIASRVETLLKPGFTQSMNGAEYQVPYIGTINFSPYPGTDMLDRIEVQGTVNMRYYG